MLVRSLALALTFGFVASAAWAETPTAPKRDCLAGICLGSTVTGPIQNSIVTVSDHKWERSVEICSGKVVGITIQTGWTLPGFVWNDLSLGATTNLLLYEEEEDDGFADAAAVFGRVTSALSDLGWQETGSLTSKSPEPPYVKRVFGNPAVLDSRLLLFGKSPDERGAVVVLFSRHADKKALCDADAAAKEIEGL